MIHIELTGTQPVPWTNPARGRNGKRFKVEKLRVYQHAVAVMAKKAMRGRSMLTGPVIFAARFVIEPPKSWSKAKKRRAIEQQIRPAVKPDLTNYVKAAEDALKGIVWKDDGQVVGYGYGTEKRYGEVAALAVTVREV